MSTEDLFRQSVKELRAAASVLKECSDKHSLSNTKHLTDISLLQNDVGYLKTGMQELKDLMVDAGDKNALTMEEKLLLEKAVEFNRKDIDALKKSLQPLSESLLIKEEQLNNRLLKMKVMIIASLLLSGGAITIGDIGKLITTIGGL